MSIRHSLSNVIHLTVFGSSIVALAFLTFECIYDLSLMYRYPILAFIVPIFSIPTSLHIMKNCISLKLARTIVLMACITSIGLYFLTGTTKIGILPNNAFQMFNKILNEGNIEINNIVLNNFTGGSDSVILFGEAYYTFDNILNNIEEYKDLEKIIRYIGKVILNGIKDRTDKSEVIIFKVQFCELHLRNVNIDQLMENMEILKLSRFQNLILLIGIPNFHVTKASGCNIVEIDKVLKNIIEALSDSKLISKEDLQQFTKVDLKGPEYSAMRSVDTIKKLSLKLNRHNIVYDTILNIMRRCQNSFLCGGLYFLSDLNSSFIHFIGEQGLDCGGLTNEWIENMIAYIAEPSQNIFDVKMTDSETFWIPKYFLVRNIEQEAYIEMIGFIFGIAFSKGVTVAINLHKTVYYNLCNHGLYFDLLSDVEEQLHRTINDTDLEVLYLVFAYVHSHCGENITVELKDDGNNIGLTDENVAEFKELYINEKYKNKIIHQTIAFKRGFKYSGAIKRFAPTDMYEKMKFTKNFTFEQLQTKLRFCNNILQHKSMMNSFLNIIKDFSPQQLRDLLRFTTGVSNFSENTKFRVEYYEEYPENSFPRAATCSNLLLIPYYTSQEIFKEKLLEALIEENTHFFLA